MRCKDFDAQIEELLSGVLHPDAKQHMNQCERCTSYFRARSAVQGGLRALASAPAQGPSRATDRAVMESYRRVLQGRSQPRPGARVVAFPGRSGASSSPTRPVAHRRWGGLAVAAALLAMVGSGVHLWIGAPTVTAPSVATAPAASAPQSPAAASPAAEANTLAAENVSRHSLARQLQAGLQAKLGAARATRPAAPAAEPVLAAKAAVAAAAADGGLEQSATASANSIMHLASTGSAAANGVAQSASSTWPGYSNLMYCDPVVCSGPMQVVHIKVPVGQVKSSAGQSESNGFVNAEVVVGPDGVARAIRVAN